jgi:hypothetical protein
VGGEGRVCGVVRGSEWDDALKELSGVDDLCVFPHFWEMTLVSCNHKLGIDRLCAFKKAVVRLVGLCLDGVSGMDKFGLGLEL